MAEQEFSEDGIVRQLSDDLARVMLDKYAVERRCIPSKEVLSNVLGRVQQNIDNFTIDAFSDEKCKSLFEYIRCLEPRVSITQDEDIAKIVRTFKHLAVVNLRSNALIDEDDLWVLYVFKNAIAYRNNQQEYMEAFKKWRA